MPPIRIVDSWWVVDGDYLTVTTCWGQIPVSKQLAELLLEAPERLAKEMLLRLELEGAF